MGKGHARNEDTYLNKGGANEISAQTLVTDLKNHALNIILNAFRIAQIGSLTIFNMVKGFMDEYEDESGVDLVNSVNQFYDATNDYYKNYFEIDSYTKLLLHLDNDVTDSENTPKTVTNIDVTFSTSSKFGTHAGSFNGSSSYLSVPDSDDFYFGTSDFTFECWANFNSITGSQYLATQFDGATTQTQFRFIDGKLYFFMNGGAGGSAEYTQTTANIEIGVWYHIAFVRNGSNFYIFVNGTSQALTVGTAISTKEYPNLTSAFILGAQIGPYGFNGLNAIVDEIRVSKGAARWTSNFTPPIIAYAPETFNMTLKSNVQVATIVPTESRVILFEEDVDSVTINTDLKAYVSRDNGTTFSQVTLEDEGNYITGARILSGVVDISAQPSGSNIKYKIETLNTKKLNLHGTAVSWK